MDEENKRYSAYANESSNKTGCFGCFGRSQKYSTKQNEKRNNDQKKVKEERKQNGTTINDSTNDSMPISYNSLQYIDNSDNNGGKHNDCGKDVCDNCGDNCLCNKHHENHKDCHEVITKASDDDVQQQNVLIERESHNDHKSDENRHSEKQHIIVIESTENSHNTNHNVIVADNHISDTHNTSSTHDTVIQAVDTTSSYDTSTHQHSSSYDTGHRDRSHSYSNDDMTQAHMADNGGSYDCGGSSGDTGGTSSYD